MFPNSPFQSGPGQFVQRPPPPPPPPVLKPLVYCEFRTFDTGEYGGAGAVDKCAVFASVTIEEMPFCVNHAGIISDALMQEQGDGSVG